MHYIPDILGEGYEQLTLIFPDDYEGKVTATLVRKKADKPTHKAVLYIHGFVDYYFQTEMAERFNQHGYDFYALDLRKYGRSKLDHQIFYHVQNLSEYDAEITESLNIIGQEHHTDVLLAGHSTGGLIATRYAVHYPQHPLIKVLWANSPFYDFNMNVLKKTFGIPVLSHLGHYLPKIKFPSGLNRWYVPSLHQDFHGEWQFNLEWKPETAKTVRLGFVHAIHTAQKEIHKGIKLRIPALIMHSSQTKNPKKWNKNATRSDVILGVRDIEKYARKIKGDVTIQTIRHGLHDLVLSAKPIREQVYQQLFLWLENKIP